MRNSGCWVASFHFALPFVRERKYFVLPFASLTPPNHFCFAKDLVLAPWRQSQKKAPSRGALFLAPTSGRTQQL